jgi:uncharacterized membrane protein
VSDLDQADDLGAFLRPAPHTAASVSREAVVGAPPGVGTEARPTARRSLAKAVAWRFVGAIDTFIISYIVTGRIAWASSIITIEMVTKIVLYFLHERAWARWSWGTGVRN